MDDLKNFAKTEDQLQGLMNTVRIFSDHIKMEFELSSCAVWEEFWKKVKKMKPPESILDEEELH